MDGGIMKSIRIYLNPPDDFTVEESDWKQDSLDSLRAYLHQFYPDTLIDDTFFYLINTGKIIQNNHTLSDSTLFHRSLLEY